MAWSAIILHFLYGVRLAVESAEEQSSSPESVVGRRAGLRLLRQDADRAEWGSSLESLYVRCAVCRLRRRRASSIIDRNVGIGRRCIAGGSVDRDGDADTSMGRRGEVGGGDAARGDCAVGARDVINDRGAIACGAHGEGEDQLGGCRVGARGGIWGCGDSDGRLVWSRRGRLRIQGGSGDKYQRAKQKQRECGKAKEIACHRFSPLSELCSESFLRYLSTLIAGTITVSSRQKICQ